MVSNRDGDYNMINEEDRLEFVVNLSINHTQNLNLILGSSPPDNCGNQVGRQQGRATYRKIRPIPNITGRLQDVIELIQQLPSTMATKRPPAQHSKFP